MLRFEKCIKFHVMKRNVKRAATYRKNTTQGKFEHVCLFSIVTQRNVTCTTRLHERIDDRPISLI